jgi:hypothetical protein
MIYFNIFINSISIFWGLMFDFIHVPFVQLKSE